MRTRFGDLFGASVAFLSGTTEEVAERTSWLQQNVSDAHRLRFGVKRDLWLVALLADTAHLALRKQNMATLRQLQDWGWSDLTNYNKSDAKTLEGIRNRCRRAAAVMSRMEQTNRKISKSADPLPLDRTKLVSHGKISVV
jgi:hypothetical protein